MNRIVPLRSLRNPGKHSNLVPFLLPNLCSLRAASLNSAIHHGIRRSKGVGFRGKERSQDGGRSHEREIKGSRRLGKRFGSPDQSQMNAGLGRGRSSTFSPRSREGSGNPRKAASTYGEAGSTSERKSARRLRGSRWDADSANDLGPSTFAKNNKDYSSARDPQEPRQETHTSDRALYPSLSRKYSAMKSPSRESSFQERYSSEEKQTREYRPEKRSEAEENSKSPRQYGFQRRSFVSEDERAPRQSGFRENGFKSEVKKSAPQFEFSNRRSSETNPSPARMDSRIPISIPYTTPASEFLYGTSVVEAALRSRRVPRRKHYKLYIYNGENRDGLNLDRDAGLERIALKGGVEVVRVSGDWLRVMDKMSGGRPHNGYILEASPLPRIPILSLGEVTSKDGRSGFSVSLDHQSREEAAVNGTDDFIKFSSPIPARKPLVLLLDSIVDPGNLGGIIRTAAFLGVTAIAVSTRNSASFTPVVLKASAGASENVTLFSVNKPAGFLVDSKAAGWRVYAAVAPSGRNDPVETSATIDELDDPLSQAPCILMLGGEGEGLRSNLRSKADVNLSITGGGRSHRVDSLNVSVAAGILCNSFLRKSKTTTLPPKAETRVDDQFETKGDLF